MGIKVKCRKCQNSVDSETLTLDSTYGMICPNCVKNKGREVRENKPKVKEEIERPPGWDKEDEYLEKMHSYKMKDTVKVEQIDDQNVKYTCTQCNYTFKYNRVYKKPGRCPYCSSDIKNISF